MPAGCKETVLGIGVRTKLFVIEHARVHFLTHVHAVRTEVVIQPVDFLHAREFHTVFIVCRTAVFVHPTFLHSFHKCVVVFKRLINIPEVCTGFGRTVNKEVFILERLQAINFLVLFLVRKRIQRIRTQVNLITNRAAMNNIQTVSRTPIRIRFRRNLNTAYKTKGICIGRIDSLRLVVPVQLQRKRIRRFVKRNGGIREILIKNGKTAVIHIKTRIELQYCRNFGKYANTFCKL